MANVSFQTITASALDTLKNNSTIVVGRIYFVTATDGSGNQYSFIARGEAINSYSILYNNSIGVAPSFTADRQKIAYTQSNNTQKKINLKRLTVGDYTKGRSVQLPSMFVDGYSMGTLGVGGDITALPTEGVQQLDYYECITAGTYGGVTLAIGEYIKCTATTPSITWAKATATISGGTIYNGDTIPVAVAKLEANIETAAANAGSALSTINSHIGSGGGSHAAATTSLAGFMSATDKTKLNGIADGAQVNVIETVKVNGAPLTVTSKAVDVTLSGLGGIALSKIVTSIDNPTDDTTIPSAKAVKTYVNNAVTGLFDFKGDIDPSNISGLSNVSVGDAYRINTARTVTLNGTSTTLEVGDLIIAASTTPTWIVLQNNLDISGLIDNGGDALISVALNGSKYSITHGTPSVSTPTDSGTLSFGGTFTAITLLSNNKGHISSYTTKTYTMPTETAVSATTNSDTSKVMQSISASGHALTPTYAQLASIVMGGYSKIADSGAITSSDSLTKALSRLENRCTVVETLLTWN
jgi:hypothetical protein